MDDLMDRIDKLMGGSSDAEQTGTHRHNVTSLLSALSTTSIPTVNLNLFCRQSTNTLFCLVTQCFHCPIGLRDRHATSNLE